MAEKITVPTLGESVTEATVSKWLKLQGEKVSVDEPLVELETDKVNVEVEDHWGAGKLLMEIFEAVVEDKIEQPLFVTQHPAEVSPLARRNDEDPEFTDRFELFVMGKEIANGFSELNDAEDQAARFREQAAARESGDDEAMYYDEDYIMALEHGLPPTAGEGIGIDRLTMFLTNNSSIQEVLFFPQMKPDKKAINLTEEEKLIFGLLKKQSPIELSSLKEQASLSNKKWDKAIKGLATHGLTKVNKTDDGLFIELIG